MSQRIVEPELLDELSPNDPEAVRSRRDLRIINRWMGNSRHIGRMAAKLSSPPRRILELGAGDGTLMLRLLRELRCPAEVWLLDMQPVVSSGTMEAFAELGCKVHLVKARLQDWLQSPDPAHVDVVMANLFLHHFKNRELQALFHPLAPITRAFISCDPRRWAPALFSVRFLWLLGCNRVTRHDALISVRAGFREKELSSLWPADGFRLVEEPAGFGSHVFSAERL